MGWFGALRNKSEGTINSISELYRQNLLEKRSEIAVQLCLSEVSIQQYIDD